MNRDDIQASGFWLNDIPGEFVPGHVIDIRYRRGIDPHVISFVVREGRAADGALLPLKNPVTIKVECAKPDSIGKDSKTFAGWYILSRRGMERGYVEYELADCRWRQEHNKLTAQYNIRSYNNEYRRDSLFANSAPWKALQAVEDALRQMGYDVAASDVEAGLAARVLPDNLGNSEGGGFFAADQREFQPLLLEPIRCDTVPNANGEIVITDRVQVRSADLAQFNKIGGNVSKADVHWQKPKKLIMESQKKIERRFSYTEQGEQSNDPTTPDIENVTPNWNPSQPDDAVSEFAEIEAWLAYVNAIIARDIAPFYATMSLERIRQVFMAPTFYPLDQADLTPEQVGIFMMIEGLLREYWRMVYRVRPVTNTPNGNVRARYASVTLGRLKADGTSDKDGAVFMDHVIDLRYAQRQVGKNPLDAHFSENIAFSLGRPAPFVAEMIDPEALIFRLAPKSAKFHHKGYYPGLFVRDKSYGGMADALAHGKIDLDTQSEFKAQFRLVVYWFGLWCGSILGGPNFQRTHKTEVPMFSDGEVDSLTIRCDDMTANFGYDGTFPGDLLNGDDLKTKARQLAREYKAPLEQGRAGLSRHGGIDVLTRGKKWVGGDIHELAVVIGKRGPASIDTEIVVLPGARIPPAPVFTREPGKKPAMIT